MTTAPDSLPSAGTLRAGEAGTGWLWTALAIGLATVGALPLLERAALPDVSWPLYLAERVLEGAALGRDYLEVNPPLFVWLSIPPVLIGRWLELSSYSVTIVGFLLAAATSVVASMRLFMGVTRLRHNEPRLLLLALVFAFFVLPRRDFSEREHLCLLLTFPWLALAVRRASGGSISTGLGLVIGAAAAIGFALKPFFLPAWVFVELYLGRRLGARSFLRLENLALMTVGAGYVGLVVLLTPEYLPFALRMRPLYSVYLDSGLAWTLVLGEGGPLPMIALLVAIAHRHAARREDSCSAVLAAATAGFLLSALLQQKGWRYHYIHAMGCATVLLTHVAAVRWQDLSWHPSGILVRGSRIVLAVLLVNVGAATIREIRNPMHPRNFEDPHLPALLPRVKALAAGEPILVMSSNPAGGWPLTQDAGAIWASRYMSLWPLAGFYAGDIRWSNDTVQVRPLGNRTGLEREFHEAVVADLLRHRPRLLVVLEVDLRIRSWGGATRFDYLAYFGEDPRFRSLFAEYQDAGRVGMYRLYRRRS